MKKPFIIIPMIAIGIATAWLTVSFVDTGMDQKYQYKFWQKNMEFENNVYFYRVLFSRSDDYGRTFSEPVDMSMTEMNAHEPKMIIMNNDVILVWRDEVKDAPTLAFAKSTDFGKTFEKKRLFFGARPDIKYYDKTLYLTYANLDDWHPQIMYSASNDGGETFSEPKVISVVDWQLSPYDDRPVPKIDVDADKIIITWKMVDKNNQYRSWNATDYGKDGTFEITSSITQRD